MNRNRSSGLVLGRLELIIGVLAGAAVLVASPATAQSEQELRQENQALKAEVERLETELDAASRRIEQLEAEQEQLRQQVRELQRQLRTPRTQPSTQPTSPAPEVTIDESVPNASPRALFNAIRQRYSEVMADIGDGTSADERDRIRYMRALNRWVPGANRDFKSQIEWHVTLHDPSQLSRGRTLTLTAVDPKSGATLGDSFDVTLTDAQIGRLDRAMLRLPDQEVMVLRGVLVPRVAVNEDRPSEGPFNNPPFIGPYAEFGFGVDVTSLVPAQPPGEQTGSNPSDGTSRNGASKDGGGQSQKP